MFVSSMEGAVDPVHDSALSSLFNIIDPAGSCVLRTMPPSICIQCLVIVKCVKSDERRLSRA